MTDPLAKKPEPKTLMSPMAFAQAAASGGSKEQKQESGPPVRVREAQ